MVSGITNIAKTATAPEKWTYTSSDAAVAGTYNLQQTVKLNLIAEEVVSGNSPLSKTVTFDFKITCVVTAVSVATAADINYDVGVGGTITQALPVVTVTPAFCKPLVVIAWAGVSFPT